MRGQVSRRGAPTRMASRGTADSTCRPRLYIYDLPKTYRHKGSPTGRGFGPTLADNASAALKIHRAHTYGTGAAFYECAMTYACRTIDPSQADLFFIPAYTDRFSTGSYCAERPCRRSADALLQRLQRVVRPSGGTYLEARKGADHFLLTPKSGLWSDDQVSIELDLRDERFGQALRFAVEDGRVLGPGKPQTRRMYRSLPWTSYVHMRSSTPWAALPWRRERARPTLVAAAFNVRDEDHAGLPSEAKLLRRKLNESCVRNRNHGCTSLDRIWKPGKIVKETSDYAREPVVDLVGLYLRSVFCLQPTGDSVSRKATIDSMLLGCIPVLFHPRQRVQWPWHWGSWVKRATVLLDLSEVVDGRIDPIEKLRRISPTRVASMQRAIAENAHCVHYTELDGNATRPIDAGTLGSAPDAFRITLEGAWELAQSGDAWRMLRPNLLPRHRRARRELCPPVPLARL